MIKEHIHNFKILNKRLKRDLIKKALDALKKADKLIDPKGFEKMKGINLEALEIEIKDSKDKSKILVSNAKNASLYLAGLIDEYERLDKHGKFEKATKALKEAKAAVDAITLPAKKKPAKKTPAKKKEASKPKKDAVKKKPSNKKPAAQKKKPASKKKKK